MRNQFMQITHPAPCARNIDHAACEQALLYVAKANTLSVQSVLGRANVASTDHRFSAAKLAPRNQPHGSTTGTRHHGHEWVLGMTQLRLVFQDEYGSRVHSFGYPFFQKLQVG
jgi:hypothetical protein